jgi:hypothetical protein
MSSVMDKSESMPTRLDLKHGPMSRRLLIVHRILTAVALLLMVYVVVMAVAGGFLGGQALVTRLINLWHQIYTIWT